MDNNEQENESVDLPTPIIPCEPATPIKIELPVEEKVVAPPCEQTTLLTTPPAPLTVIQNIQNPPKPILPEPMNPVNVSIKLPDDLNERKNLIRKSLDLSEKEIKFTPEPIKAEVKQEEPIKTEIKEENIKTELIIPKVIPMEKSVIKEETELSNESVIVPKEEIYKNELFVPQNLHIKEQPMSFNIKEPLEHMNATPHYKESQLINPCNKENKELLNHQNYGLKEALKQEPYSFSNTIKDQPPINHTINTVIKLEPHDEPIELTNNANQQPRELYQPQIQNPPITIPTVIPMSQQLQQNNRGENSQFEEEKRLERPERPEMPLPVIPPQIGQPPIQNLMQTGNLVTIGGNQPMSHYGYLGSPYGHTNPSPRSLDKNTLPHMSSSAIPISVAQPVLPTTQSNVNVSVNLQNEPQNLKIKQEISESSSSQSISSAPTPPTSQPLNSDPLQSLKDVKVPGFSLPSSAVSQPLAGNVPNPDNRPSSGHSFSVDNIKKEMDYPPISSHSSVQSNVPTLNPPTERSPALKVISSNPATPSTATPPLRIQATPPPHPTMSHSAVNLISPVSTSLAPPTSIPQPVMHPSQQAAYGNPMAHPHLIHHPFLAMHPYHSHPYASAGYPFPYPYPYGPVPQPHAIPPPQGPASRHDMMKPSSTIETSTMLTSHHSSSSSSVMTRREVQVRESEENQERHHLHETTMMQHHSTSHHSSVHASTEKPAYGGGASHSLTISHSTSSSTSQSVKHKISQSTVRTASPHHSHHPERMSPRHVKQAPVQPQAAPASAHHLMIQPPSMGHHGSFAPPSMGGSSLEALKAHAQAAANMQQGSMHPPASSPLQLPPSHRKYLLILIL